MPKRDATQNSCAAQATPIPIMNWVYIFAFSALFACGAEGHQDIQTLWLPGFRDSVHKPYNPSLVEYDGRFYAATRFSRTPKIGGKEWYMDRVYMCRSEYLNVSTLRCINYYPFSEPYNECEYPPDIRGGSTDIWGLGDLKLFVWPGSGVYALFGRKPPRRRGELYCNDKVVYVPWLVEVDPLARARPVQLRITSGYQYPTIPRHLEEKNWMPWTYRLTNGTQLLYMTHMVNPHRILEVGRNGNCHVVYETEGRREVFRGLMEHDIHGGPPVVFIDGKYTEHGDSYYAGILHYFSYVNTTFNGRSYVGLKLYRHFAFKFSAKPPFNIFAVSDEIALPSVSETSDLPVKQTVAFVSGFSLGSKGRIYLSYGVGDLESRVLMMSVQEFEAMFTGNVLPLKRRYGDYVET